MLIGLVGTGVSTYFFATAPKNDKNRTYKIVGLSLSIFLALVGMFCILYYYYGSSFSSGEGGGCALAELAQQQAPMPAPAPAPTPAPGSGPETTNVVNITMTPNSMPKRT